MFKVLGIGLAALAIALAVVPRFTDCQSQGKMITLRDASGKVTGTTSMKCHWTGVAELGVAIPLGMVGIMMAFARKKETARYLGISGIALAAVAIALPNGMIGVCKSSMMTCVSTMKPALTTIGSVAALGSVVGLVWSWRSKSLT